MSYSKEEMQAAFDDIVVIISDVMPNFRKQGLILISSTQSEEELIELEAYKKFKQDYGEDSAGYLLAAKRKAEAQKLQTSELEDFWSHEVYGYFSADGIANVWAHWIKEQPPHFAALLHKYPGILSLLRDRNSAVVWGALEEAIETYRPSAAFLAEFMAIENHTVEVIELIRTAGPKLAGFAAAVGAFKNEEKKKPDANSIDSISLDPSSISAEKKERAQKRELGADAALAFLVGDNTEQLAMTANGQLASIHECNGIALELAILEGKESFEAVVVGQRKKKLTTVSSVIGDDSVGKSALEKLEIADKARAKAQEFLWLEFIVNIKRKAVEESTVNGRSAAKDIHKHNQSALELAIIEGRESFEAVVPGQEKKELTTVLFAIGRNPVGKSISERLSIADEMEVRQNRRLQSRIKELKSHLQEIYKEDILLGNQAALKLAILEGKDTFENVMIGKEGKKKQKVSVIIGLDPRQMSTLEKLKAVDNMEILRVKRANSLLHEASKEMQEQMAQLSQDIQRKPSQAKMEKFRETSKTNALVRDEPTYPLSPEADPKGEMHFGHTPMKEGKNGINEKLKLLGARFKENKIANKAISALISFIDTLIHLPELVEKPKLKRTQSAPNIHSKLEPPPLKKRSLSTPNMADNNPLVTASTGSHMRLFSPAQPRPTNADISQVQKAISMVPRLLRIPGTRST